MKAIIADDEIYICSLIKHVVRWEELGIELLGAFSSGEDVLTQFAKEPADILICDIEMPGMSGTELIERISADYPQCECVVISGFRDFEYARTAMQFGVTHYLLKPIDAEELNGVLRSVVESCLPQRPAVNTISEQAIRLGLADYLNFDMQGETINGLNQKFHYQFKEGVFHVLSHVFTDIHPDFLPKVMSLLSDSMRQKLMDFCYDAELFRTSAVSSLIIVNYDASRASLLHSMLDNALRETLAELEGKTQCRCFFGVGVPVVGPQGFQQSMQSSLSAVCGRFVDYSRPIYYAEFMENWNCFGKAIKLSYDEKQRFVNAVEAVNTAELTVWIEQLFLQYKKDFEFMPRLSIDLCMSVAELLLATFDNLNVPVEDKDAFRKKAIAQFSSQGSLVGLKQSLIALSKEEVAMRLLDKQQNMAMYAQQAINYINKNFAQIVTLELIADKLHISPVYLSVVFKSETGMNYSKYLASVRIEKAKELLKLHTMNLSQVANAVGYDSTSYFSNLFRKHTGLKPSEYRRLHQHDIGK